MLRTHAPIVFTLMAFLAVGPGFAPEHLHAGNAHHSNATVHRHLAPHHAEESHDRARLNDNDDHVVWLTIAWLQTAVYHVPNLATIPTIARIVPALGETWRPLVLDDSAPPHGPPCAPRSLRAPPTPA